MCKTVSYESFSAMTSIIPRDQYISMQVEIGSGNNDVNVSHQQNSTNVEYVQGVFAYESHYSICMNCLEVQIFSPSLIL